MTQKTYQLSNTVTESKEFKANNESYFLIRRHKFDCLQYESIRLDKREALRVYLAIQDSILDKD